MSLDPDAQRVVEWILSVGLEFDPEMAPAQARARLDALSSPGAADPSPAVVMQDLRVGGRPARIALPRDRRREGAMVWFHGGGWVMGSPRGSDAVTARLAASLGIAVLSPSYRLAPEHPFPAAVDDAVAVCGRLLGESSVPASLRGPLVVAGDSAGANLAAVALMVLRDESGRQPAGQVLVCPFVDAVLDQQSVLEHAHNPFLSLHALEWCLGMYAPAADRRDPRLSPLRAASHSDLAPALVITAEVDVLADQGRDYAAALGRAGVDATHRRYAGMFHGFFGLDDLVPRAAAAFHDVVEWVAQMTGEP